MYGFQKELWATITGNDPKEMKIIMSGRQIGKSTMAQMWNQMYEIGEYFTVIDQAIVDHAQWYTVKCSGKISSWIKSQPSEMWHEHIDKDWMVYKNTLDIHEKIYTMLQLKYGHDRV